MNETLGAVKGCDYRGPAAAGQVYSGAVLGSLRFRLLALVIASAIPAIGVLVYSAAEEQRRDRQAAQENALQLARFAAAHQETLTEGTRQLLLSVSRLPLVRDFQPQELEPVLQELLRANPVYANFGIIAPDGRVVASAIALKEPVNLSDRAYFRRAVESGEFSIGEYQIGRITGRPTINFGQPIYDSQRGLKGVLFAALELTWLNEVAKELKLPPGSALSLFDRQGLVLARYPDPERWVGRTAHDAPVVNASQIQSEGVTEGLGLDGKPRLYGFAPVRAGKNEIAIVAVGLPTETVQGEARRILFRNLVVLGLVLLLTIAAAWIGSDLLLLRRARELARVAERISAGDLGERADVRGPAEVASLAGAFNAMADRLSAMIAAEQREKEALAERVNRLVGERTRELALLNELGEALQACASMEEAYGVVGRIAPQIFPDRSGALFVFRSSKNVLELATGWGSFPKTAQFPPEDCWGVRRGKTHRTQSVSRDLSCPHLSGFGSGSTLCAPLAAQGESYGLFEVLGPEGEWPESSVRLAEAVSDQLALAIANLRLRETLRNQSVRDPLTGLFNRRYLEESLDRELARAKRGPHPLSLMILDLDHFKRFNDSFGHDAGDTVLKRLAETLQPFFRGSDVVCRYGGEEFVILLPESGREQCRARAEDLRKRIEGLALDHHGIQLGRLTLSIGLASYPENGEDAGAVIKAADEALYAAKAGGRNQVREAPPRGAT